MVIKEDGEGIVRVMRDKRLSLKAKGLIAYLKQCPEIVDVGLWYIVGDTSDGYASVRSAIREAEEAGYLEVERSRDNGKMGTYTFRLKV